MDLRALLKALFALCLLGAIEAKGWAGTRSSVSYSIVADSLGSGGGATASLKYASSSSLGNTAGMATVAFPVETLKAGYIGQLYNVTGLYLSPSFVANGGTQQLSAVQTLDDGTTLALLGAS
jgi:hypothetical protein